ncbi:hypothetical protein N9985_02985 [Gammaproteobacteria bacterium]|nr:hypothetical protein [Gammaproteobacteria bacterium]
MQNLNRQSVSEYRSLRSFLDPATAIPRNMLIRHYIEHVMRIRLFRPLDAEVTCLLNQDHQDAADLWGRYARSEAVHDRYFLRDLEQMGISRAQVDTVEPFTSTRKLVNFLLQGLHSFGPSPVILYSYWAEYNSEVGSGPMMDRVADEFGEQAVCGAKGHRALDQKQDHLALVAEVLHSLIREQKDLVLATNLLAVISRMLDEYFLQLLAWGQSRHDAQVRQHFLATGIPFV